MLKSSFYIKEMDCPSEENLIRMRLQGIMHIKQLDFDLTKRELGVYHTSENEEISKALESLNLGSKFISINEVDERELGEENSQKKILWTVLIINFLFFVLEITTGLVSKSMGLVADSLDMLADSIVYGLSLFAVGGSVLRKKNISKIAGYFQITLAGIGFLEVIRRFFGFEQIPDFKTMIIVSIFALFANGICLYILQKSKSKEAHMRASMIFTSNDVIINLGVILAGLLVMWTGSSKPDLIIGTIVFLLVMKGALRILALSKEN